MGSKQTYGSLGRTDLHWFDPNDLTIITDPAHPLFDERANMPPNQKYIDSITQLGVLEPVLVRVNGQDDNGKQIVEVMEGRQRVRCTRVANEALVSAGKEPHRVPAIIKRVDGNTAMDIMVAGNEIRTQDGPLVRARKMQRYIDNGRSIKEIMVAFGVKSETTVKNLLTLLDLHEDVQKAIEKGVVGIGLAKQLSVFPREEQPQQLQIVIDAGNAAALGKSSEETKTNGASNGSNGHAVPTDPVTAEVQALLGPPTTTADDDEPSGAPVALDAHTAPANPPGKRGAKKAAKDALKKQMGKRGAKLRARSVKTVAQIKEAREALKGSRSDTASAFDAALMWVMGEEDALEGYKHIYDRLKGI